MRPASAPAEAGGAGRGAADLHVERSRPAARHLPGAGLRGRPPGRAAGVPHRPPDARPPGGAAAPARGRPAGLAVGVALTPSRAGASRASRRRPIPLGGPTVPEEGFFRAGRTRPGPNVHGPRTGPPPGGSRPGGGSSRRPRWDTDAGITDRDVAALRWLGQQYAARSDVLRVLLGRLSPGSPRVAGQLGEATLRDRSLTAGRTAAWSPATACSATCGSPPPPRRCGWSAWTCAPGPSSSPSSPTSTPSGVVRLALEPSIPAGGRWLSERELRREAGKSHVPDAAIQLPDDPDAAAGAGLYGEDVDPLPKRVAVEVELTRKGAARLREAWTRPRHGRWTADRLLRPARGRQLPDRPAPAHPASPSHPGPPAARGAGHDLPAPRRCLVTRPHRALTRPAAGRPPPASRSPARPASRPPTACCWSCCCWSGSPRCPSWPGCSGRR